MLKTEPWIIRATLGAAACGSVVLSWAASLLWLYFKLMALLRGSWGEWLTWELGRNATILSIMLTALFVLGTLAFLEWVGVPLMRLLRVPDEAFDPAANVKTYPLHTQTLSRKAKHRAGQEGFVDGALERFEEFSRSPLTPPVRPPKPPSEPPSARRGRR